ncbi:hypothetical protein [Candidatus Clostridium stratigraminis]|uniref:DUF5668 domain-containing protein n=1 Tax=Candidatus Clostridium stratigraminis TaxID=3381661 RepID=A0ABW8SYY4_9CLOT
MIKGRRVGTLTAGMVLIVFGLMFLLRLVTVNINILIITSLWPLILVSVGIEILAAYVINKEEKILYDFSAIVLVVILVFFAMGMGGTEFIFNHLSYFKGTI